ncbi:Relaxin-3 [Bagarius yarrelli]|uniref:Relaxin-3 n=1 Tax=Bagarius yarrelli TaxID=175774 RepID=A0A556VYC8_BAGYA|nr:Relaxin-3 [Bagarius yarrelli]
MRGSYRLPLVPLLLMWAVCSVVQVQAEVKAVKLCGREFIRAVVYTCGGSRWRRLLTPQNDVLSLEEQSSDAELGDSAGSDLSTRDLNPMMTNICCQLTGRGPIHSKLTGQVPIQSELTGQVLIHSELTGQVPIHSKLLLDKYPFTRSSLDEDSSTLSSLDKYPSNLSSLDKYLSTLSSLDKYLSTLSSLGQYPSNLSSLDKYLSTLSSLDKYLSTLSSLDKYLSTLSSLDKRRNEARERAALSRSLLAAQKNDFITCPAE